MAAVYQPSSGLAQMYVSGQAVTLTNNGPNPVTTPLTSSLSGFFLGSRGGGSYRFKGGTGKSTHAKLWQQYFGPDRAVIINDDKPALRLMKGIFYAYGTR